MLGVRLPEAALKHMCEITVATINLAFPPVPMLDFPHKKLNSFPSFLWGEGAVGFNQEKPQCAQSSHHQHGTRPTWPPVASLVLQALQDTVAIPRMLCPGSLLWLIPTQYCPHLQIHHF